ncbi:MAG TPA: hypothetical protein VNA25_02535 [Phycisphaerae bacterium]|nr:hypothetical protein [Phycisphaerae bacterium]HUT56733.1 hypothetical protein [Phycisphaerae bacterium]
MTDLPLHAGTESPGGRRSRRGRAGLVVGLLAVALVAVTSLWAVPGAFGGWRAPPWAVGVSGALLVGLLAAIMSIDGVRALAWHTFAQCVRMKVAAVFVFMLVVSLAALPFIMTGDGTLAGAIRTLLAYGVSITALLLSLVTVLLATSVVASDVRQKQIFMTATKPLARWQYILGRWLGVVMFDAVLLVLAMAAVYATAQYLRRQRHGIGPEDRRVVETEVFSARAKVAPEPQDIEREVQERIAYLKRENLYDGAVEAWKSRTSGDEELAERKLTAEIRKDITEARNSAGPNRGLVWRFSGIETGGRQAAGSGTVEQVLRGEGRLRIAAGPRFLSKLLFKSPVRIDGVDGRVVELGEDTFVVQFYARNIPLLAQSGLVGRQVEVIVDPTIQVTYKATTTGTIELQTADSGEQVRPLPSAWEVENPQTHARHLEFRKDPTGRPATLTVSARAVSDEEGRLVVRFTNLSNVSAKIAPSDISVLHPAGTFEWNYARAGLLMLLQLAFLAGLGVFAGSFLSFQVACLVCLTALPFSMARSYLAQSVEVSSVMAPGLDALTIMGHIAVKIMAVLLPDFSSTWPSNALVDGLYISWDYLGRTAAVTIGIRAVAVLALGCLIFRGRELARVQV